MNIFTFLCKLAYRKRLKKREKAKKLLIFDIFFLNYKILLYICIVKANIIDS